MLYKYKMYNNFLNILNISELFIRKDNDCRLIIFRSFKNSYKFDMWVLISFY